MEDKVRDAMKDAESKAWEALSGYKFIMFGYHASRWVNYNRLLPKGESNPFRQLVNIAREYADSEGPVKGNRI